MNNPVKYTDPDGHNVDCSIGDSGCLIGTSQHVQIENASTEIESKFSVSINRHSGSWTLGALAAVERGMAALQGEMGSTGFKRLYNGVTFSITTTFTNACLKNNMCSDPNNVFIRPDVSNPTYIEHETVHELAHIWDFSCNGCLQKGMMAATGGSQSVDANGDIVYQPGGTTPTNYAKQNMGEDWAESVTSYVFYPAYGTLDQGRYQYVIAQFVLVVQSLY